MTTALLATLLLAPPNPSERKAILDAVRPVVEATLRGQKIKFVVRHIGIERDWAFLDAQPVLANGKRIDFRRSDFAEAARDGMVDDGVVALLRKKKGRWRIVDHALFPTDVPWEPWGKQYGAPKGIFPHYARPG